MFSKILLALGVVLAISALGSAVKCNNCAYSTALPKALQKCQSINCPSEYCYSQTFVYKNGTEVYARSCGIAGLCPDAGTNKVCSLLTKVPNSPIKSCDTKCCKTDNCNTITSNNGGSPDGKNPGTNSATGIMTKTLIPSLMMVIAGFLLA
ncbi:Hypothetical predicted protein [Paramuricea clavata]|uniref:Uncharacterized protein n=2 Tax=Paramuricea clavata TaxID=317549 RepID=A0A7D9E0D5_PARCT|nr:Hypothetical predicted protein [Paramuricea clavata]